MGYTDTMHTIIAHGFAHCDIKHKIGEEFTARTRAIKAKKILNVSCNIDLNKTKGETTSVHIGKWLSGEISILSRQSCIAKNKVIMLMVMYAIRTHPDCTGFHKLCDENIAECVNTINTRIEILKLTPVSI